MVVLVTGSSKGIGSSIIKEFAKNKYDVIINYNNDYKSALELKEYVESTYKVNADIIRNIISFLAENEQYGNDWSVEIAELDKILDIILRQ